MEKMPELQLAQLLEDISPDSILEFISRLFSKNYPGISLSPIITIFPEIRKLYNGEYKGYAACDTPYHNYPHTIDVFLATARILDGYLQKNPGFPDRLVTTCLTASLFHDVGYITTIEDTEGTGAKYTVTHVDRSISFLKTHFKNFNLTVKEADSAGRMIRATQLACDFFTIPFLSTEERITGAILAAADLVGQMSNRDYLERLLFLYFEFREARIPGYTTEFDILKKTLAFYNMVEDRLKNPLMDVAGFSRFHFLREHGIDRDLYDQAIKRQIDYLRKIIEDESTNFRHKLNRADWLEKTETG